MLPRSTFAYAGAVSAELTPNPARYITPNLDALQPQIWPLLREYPNLYDAQRAVAIMSGLGYSPSRIKQIMYLAEHESTYRGWIKNPTSSAGGFVQILASTFRDFDCAGDRFNLADNIICANTILNSHPNAMYLHWLKHWRR